MDTDHVIEMVLAYCERAHPKSCSSCGRAFADLRDYFANTTPIGTPQCYDSADISQSLGTMAFVNCRCRSTLALWADQETMAEYGPLIEWLNRESEATGASTGAVLEQLRSTIRARVLARPVEPARLPQL